jgi:hypothetical protein
VSVPVYLYTTDGWPLGECRTLDISAGGARLDSLPADELPKQFLLCLSRDGKVRRNCRVMWRTDKQIGVHFYSADDTATEKSATESDCP